MQQAKEQGFSLRAIARNLGMAKNTAKKYASAKSPPTKKLSAKERAKAEALAAPLVLQPQLGRKGPQASFVVGFQSPGLMTPSPLRPPQSQPRALGG